MKPSRSSACAVVSKGMRDSSHLQRSLAAGSSACFGAGLVVIRTLRARYSSTPEPRSHQKTRHLLPSRHRRTFRPLHVDRQDAGGRGHENWTQHQAEHSEDRDATHYADENDQPAQITSRRRARPQWPVNPSHSAAGTKIKPEPTTGTSEKKAIATPQNSGVGRPTSTKPSPPSTPWIAAIIRLVVTLAEMRSPACTIIASRCSASNGRMLRTPRIISSASRKK